MFAAPVCFLDLKNTGLISLVVSLNIEIILKFSSFVTNFFLKFYIFEIHMDKYKSCGCIKFVAAGPNNSLARTMNSEANVLILVYPGLVTITDQSYRTFYTKS